MTQFYKATLSGSYKSGDKIVDYRRLTGLIPYVDYDLAQSALITRYAKLWLANENPDYLERVDRVREVFIDKIEKVEFESTYSFVGKSITEMDWVELQDLALAFDLRRIPLFRDGYSLRESQIIAYVDYNNLILGRTFKAENGKEFFPNEKDEGFNISDYPEIIIEGSEEMGVRDHIEKISNSEAIKQEFDKLAPKESKEEVVRLNTPKNIDMFELKEIAKEKGIKFFAGIKYNDLYKKVYSVDPA